ncbi:uncharacterized protein SCHCODRAFT_02627205, partial [Schizophyllum commune H4-8]
MADYVASANVCVVSISDHVVRIDVYAVRARPLATTRKTLALRGIPPFPLVASLPPHIIFAIAPLPPFHLDAASPPPQSYLPSPQLRAPPSIAPPPPPPRAPAFFFVGLRREWGWD